MRLLVRSRSSWAVRTMRGSSGDARGPAQGGNHGHRPCGVRLLDFPSVACPVCGGWDRVDSPDGGFVCTTQRMVAGVPPGASGNPGPAAIPIYGHCGTRYGERDETAQAALAFGRQRQAQEVLARNAADDLAWLDEVSAALLGLSDPIERLVQAVRVFVGLSGGVTSCAGLVVLDGLQRILPDAQITFSASDLIDLEELDHWFLSKTVSLGITPDRLPRERKTMFGWKRYNDLGWYFSNGSTARNQSETGDDREFRDIGLTTSGQRVYRWSSAWCSEPPSGAQGESYNPYALAKMAAILRLPEFPPKPSPDRVVCEQSRNSPVRA